MSYRFDVTKIQSFLIIFLFSLNIVEHNLQQIVAQQGSNAREFAELVKENEEILDAMKVSKDLHCNDHRLELN